VPAEAEAVGGLLAGSLAGMAAGAHHLTGQLSLRSTGAGAGQGSAAAGASAEDVAGAGLAALCHLPEMHMVVAGILLAAAGALLPGTTVEAPPLAEAPVPYRSRSGSPIPPPRGGPPGRYGSPRRLLPTRGGFRGGRGGSSRSGVPGQAEAGHTPQALAITHRTSTGVVVGSALQPWG